MRASALWLLLALALPADGEVTRLANGNVTVSARFTPLGLLLRQIAALAPLDTSLIDPKIERSLVSLALDDVPVPVALAAAFEAAGVSYVVWGDDPTLLRFTAFAPGSSAPVAAPKPTVPPPPTYNQYGGVTLPNGITLPPGISPDDPDVAMIGGPAPPREGAPEDDPELAEALAVEQPTPPPQGYDPAYADILGPPPNQAPEIFKKP